MLNLTLERKYLSPLWKSRKLLFSGLPINGNPAGGVHDIYNVTDLILRCNIAGFPNPRIEWSKNSFFYNSGTNLSIPVNTTIASGTYTCVVGNSEGKDEENIEINIIQPPNIKSNYEKFHNLTEFESFDLECPVTGQLDKVVWLMVSWFSELTNVYIF